MIRRPSIGTIAGHAFSVLRRAGAGFAIRTSPRFAIGSALVAIAGLSVLLTSRRRAHRKASVRLQRVPGIDEVSALLFDVDGTLIDSNAAHAQTWAQALSEHGFPCEASRVRPFVGMGGDKLLPSVAGIAAGFASRAGHQQAKESAVFRTAAAACPDARRPSAGLLSQKIEEACHRRDLRGRSGDARAPRPCGRR